MKEGGNSKGDEKQKGSPGALFPRLHVKEAKNNGPRAPPRNKMALYEQFTIPSHRLQQAPAQQQQQQQHSPMPQHHFMPQSYTGGYYLPYYMTAPMSFQHMNVMVGQPPQGYDMECDQGELQRVPGASVGESSGQLTRVSSLQSRAGSSKSSKQAVRDEQDFTVPTYLSKKAPPGSKSLKEKQLSVASSVVTSLEQMQDFSKQVPVAGSERQPNSWVPDRNVAQSARENDGDARENDGDASAEGDKDVDENQGSAGQSRSNSFESNGGIDNQSDEEATGRSPQEEGEGSDDSATSVLDNTTAPVVTSKEVMSVVGNEPFWKMRKAMQRQQRIFQKQLFELHRLTKVQQLMAASGINDESEKEEGRSSDEKQTDKSSKNTADVIEISKPDNVAQSVESPGPQAKKSANTSAATGEFSSHEYYAPGAPPAMQGSNYGHYPGYPGVNQWYAPVPVQFPYHHQHFPAPTLYNTPYGPVFGGPGPMPFVQYSCDQRPQDPRYNVVPPQAQPWQPPPTYFHDPAVQWMGYMNPNCGQSSMGSFKDSSRQTYPPKETQGASSSQCRKEQGPGYRFTSQAGSSSAGFSLIQRADAGNNGNKQEQQQNHQQNQEQQHQQQQNQPQQDQPQQDQPQQYQSQQYQQVKLVGKYVEGRQPSNPGVGIQKHGVSPYSRPGFHSVTNNERTSTNRIIKVTPKATMVTPESAAEILQSIQQERPER